MDFLMFCALTQKNDLFFEVMNYIIKHEIYIHVHFLNIGEFSLVTELFGDSSKINKDNKLAFLRYIEA